MLLAGAGFARMIPQVHSSSNSSLYPRQEPVSSMISLIDERTPRTMNSALSSADFATGLTSCTIPLAPYPSITHPPQHPHQPMLLAIDVGNTNIVAGLFKKEDLQQRWRISTDTSRSADEYRALFHILADTHGIDLINRVDAVVIGSVVPPVTSALHRYCHDWLDKEPLQVHAGLDVDMALLVTEPNRVGVDRLLNAIAARSLFGAPCITLDLGTATKFDVVDTNGAFIGGAIAPGFHTSADALVRGTALLPRIDLEAPPHPIGDDTATAMQSGIVLGYVSLIEGMLARIQAVLPQAPVTVVATGGLASLAVSLSDVVDHYEPNLTLYGLRIVFERNKNVKRIA